MNIHKAQPEDLKNKDLLIFGTPVHVNAPAMELRRFLNKLPEDALKKTKKIAIYATYFFSGSELALSTVEEILRDKGASGEIQKLARRAGFFRSLWHVVTGDTQDEEAWIAFGKLVGTS
jgi:flavodoxin